MIELNISTQTLTEIAVYLTRNSGHYVPFFLAPVEDLGGPLGPLLWGLQSCMVGPVTPKNVGS